jgi:hypothetical protein
MKRSVYAFAFLLTSICLAQTTPVVVPITAECATSTDGSVVGVQNPLDIPFVAAGYTGTLPVGNYYVQIGWYDASSHVTLVSPEVQVQLSGTGQLQVSPPTSGMPATAVGMNVYIGASSGAETLQGTTTGAATFTQSTPLTSGAALPTINTTVCKIIANDAGWPTGTGYNVSLTTPSGATMPGYPMRWQLLGPGGTVNLGQGLPYYNGTVNYPIPILAIPYNHAPQSISGPLSMTGYSISQVLSLGVGTSLPVYGVDVEGTGNRSYINANGGYLVNGSGGTAGYCLSSDGTAYDTPIVCGGTVYYQTWESNGTPVTQATTANFVSPLTISTAGAVTTIGLADSGVTAGTYVYPASISVSPKGIVTAITAGTHSAACSAYTSTASSGCAITADGKLYEWVQGAATTTMDTVLSTSWPIPFTSYCFPHISVETTGTDYGEMPVPSITSWGISSVNYYIVRNADHGGMTLTPLLSCIGY